MNELTLYTKKTTDPYVFETRWMTGLQTKGLVRVHLPDMEDARIAAELAAAEHLLVERNVCGHNKSGSGLIVTFSVGTIKKLMREDSTKEHLARFANFMRTRFLGAVIEVEAKKHTWATDDCLARVEDIVVTQPRLTTIEVKGLGPVELTAHAVEQYITRFQRPEVKAWRELQDLASSVEPYQMPGRTAKADVRHRRPGSHWIDASRQRVLVITPPVGPGRLPSIVTVVPPTLPGTRH